MAEIPRDSTPLGQSQCEMDPVEIVKLKERLDPTLHFGVAARFIGDLVANMLKDAHRLPTITAEPSSEVVDLEPHANLEEFTRHVGYLAATWAMTLQRAIAAPSSEWPYDILDPSAVAAAVPMPRAGHIGS